MLRNWIRNRAKIAGQKKASRRAQEGNTKGKEHKIEQLLFKEFQEARQQGKAVRCQWFRRHAKALYRQQYPDRITQNPETQRLLYSGFKFSNGWFQSFCRRWRISNRCQTKTAQNPPEDYREKVMS